MWPTVIGTLLVFAIAFIRDLAELRWNRELFAPGSPIGYEYNIIYYRESIQYNIDGSCHHILEVLCCGIEFRFGSIRTKQISHHREPAD